MNRLWKNLRRLTRQQYRIEKKLLAGNRIAPRSNEPSVIFVTLHKAASVFVWDVLSSAAKSANYRLANFDGYHFHRGQNAASTPYQAFSRTGFLYGPFRRGLGHITESGQEPWSQFKILLQLRDPRDVLTSSYFSFLHSHCVVNRDRKRMKSIRARMGQQTIDEHVRGQTGFMQCQVNQYADLMMMPNCQVVHYEDMVNDPQKWISQVTQFLNWHDNPNATRAFEQVAVAANDLPKAEAVQSHRRKVRPGDFREKLSATRIADLDQRFSAYYEALQMIDSLPTSYEVNTHRHAS